MSRFVFVKTVAVIYHWYIQYITCLIGINEIICFEITLTNDSEGDKSWEVLLPKS